MPFAKLSFKTLLLLLVCLAVVLLFVKLGFWQLSRAEEKLEIKASVETKSQQLLDLSNHKVGREDRFSGVVVKGEYLVEHTFLLDRQLMKGVPAYAVITPFKFTVETESYSSRMILVNRGLVAATSDRGVLPEVETPTAEIEIKGNLNYPTPEPEFWRDSFPIEKNSVWQFMDMSLLSKRINGDKPALELAPLVLELDKNLDQVGGYVRQWRSYDDQWVNRHRAYALQWFSMAFVFVLMCFFAFRIKD